MTDATVTVKLTSLERRTDDDRRSFESGEQVFSAVSGLYFPAAQSSLYKNRPQATEQGNRKGNSMRDQFKGYDRWKLQSPEDIDEAIERSRRRDRDDDFDKPEELDESGKAPSFATVITVH